MYDKFEKWEEPIPKELLSEFEVDPCSAVRATKTHILRSSSSTNSPEEFERMRSVNLKVYIKRYKRKLDIWTGVRCDQQ